MWTIEISLLEARVVDRGLRLTATTKYEMSHTMYFQKEVVFRDL